MTNDFKLIPLTQGQFAKVSPEDFEWLSRWKWCAAYSRHTKSFYAMRGGKSLAGKRSHSKMHREILGMTLGDGLSGDHINRDTLDNRRSNLRKVDNFQSRQNRGMFTNNKTGYKGVYLHKVSGKFAAQVKVGGKAVHLGLFDDARNAALARDGAEIMHHGEFAMTNFERVHACA